MRDPLSCGICKMEEEMHLTLKGKKRQSKNINIRDDIVIILIDSQRVIYHRVLKIVKYRVIDKYSKLQFLHTTPDT